MKKCPYCAEEIKDEAIVCRYCGRDLPSVAEIIEVAEDKPQSKAKVMISPWKQGAKVSAIITVLYAIGTVNLPNVVPLISRQI